MAQSRRFRFGLKVRTTSDGKGFAEAARRAESLGYDALLVSDHPTHPQLGPIAAATALACATQNVRVGSSVVANDFRHPVLLAKEFATLDVISGGRAELGIGTGWKQEEYEDIGLQFDRAGRRIERLGEAIDIMRLFFAGERFDFEGEHYRIRALEPYPPLSRSRVPIMLGGGGRKFLTLAAQKADIIGINPAARSGAHDASTDADAKEAVTDEKLGWIREAAGERLNEIEIAMQVYAGKVTDDRAEGDRALQERYPFAVEEARRVPYAWVGSIDSICEAIEERRERWGISYWVVMAEGMEEMAPVVERLAGR
jgi:probable F420-dependent oxidoreductase